MQLHFTKNSRTVERVTGFQSPGSWVRQRQALRFMTTLYAVRITRPWRRDTGRERGLSVQVKRATDEAYVEKEEGALH
jgi:hypothetical protein